MKRAIFHLAMVLPFSMAGCGHSLPAADVPISSSRSAADAPAARSPGADATGTAAPGAGASGADAPTVAAPARISIGDLAGGAKLVAFQAATGKWGLRIEGAGLASATQSTPVMIESFDGKSNVTRFAAGYDQVQARDSGGGLAGAARIAPPAGGEFAAEDRWTISSGALHLERKVTVTRPAEGGFLSGIALDIDHELSWPEVSWFAPGMMYGGFAHLTETAIGGRAHYRPGDFTVRIREDRLPAPVFGACFGDGSTLAVLDEAPDGATTRADGRDVEAVPLVDERLRFGALGAEERGRKLSAGYWFPGSEGEVTYRGDTYPGGQMHKWRLRFHPARQGLTQRYRVAFRVGREEPFQDFYPRAWRWAWDTLKPRVARQDIPAVRRSLTDLLADRVQSHGGRTGIPNFIDAIHAEKAGYDERAILGFCGKSLEAAEFLLLEASRDPSPRGERLRKLGEAIADSFVKLKVSPPEGEGFHFKTGLPVCAIGSKEIFLRSFGDDVKALLRAYRRERQAGRDHPDWLRWCREFADWLLTQQQPSGGFPRTWQPGTGKVVSSSPNSSYNAVPLLVLLSRITGERRYLDAAVGAADFCWANGQARGLFVGGTIDNPDVLDKEASTLSLEAYLALHEAARELSAGARPQPPGQGSVPQPSVQGAGQQPGSQGSPESSGGPSPEESRWRARAVAAASFAETWIYCWNVPMPEDEDDRELHWKKGVPAAGLQLISSGHSLVDAYMAFDADEFARLHKITGDAHFLEVARILLHNTKGMTALPGRTYDLAGPGWQQEHWSLAPRRGFGLHRGWLPWVATSQLNGIFGLMELDGELFEMLAAAPSPPRYDAVQWKIVVDGDPSDWEGVPECAVRGESHLWFGQGMTREKWSGDDDLSYSWRACWSGSKLQFLFEVRDDKVVEAGAPFSYLCDCVEVYLDPAGRGGRRVVPLDGRDDWFARCDPGDLRGYEMHFLPTLPPSVYLDHGDKYAADKPQTERFFKEWSGEVAARKTPDGYVMEVGFSVPGVALEEGKMLRIEIGVCDDDGRERESILMWTGTQCDFWVTMDEYGKVKLVGGSP